MVESVAERFMRYARIDTQSKEDVDEVPSTRKQFDLANLLLEELRAIGLDDAVVDDHAYVMATLPASPGHEGAPTVGFLAHMDTSPEEPGGANPMVWKEYDGGTIQLPNGDVVITPVENKELLDYLGQDIITSDGTSLLGADDKSGIAEIMAGLETIIEQDIPHGRIRVAFTPDEEVAKGTAFFSVDDFGADFAYTLDGSVLGQVECENFNAATGIFTLKGYNVHPGYAKDKMKNSMRGMGYLMTLIPPDIAPETTEGYEGYLHPHSLKGSVDTSLLKVLIRDFSEEGMEEKREVLRNIRNTVAEKYPDLDVQLEIKESYRNMKEILDQHSQVLETVMLACRNIGVEPVIHNIRGGTDGARLCFMGLPTPNIFSGGVNFHSKKEFIPIPSMEKAVEVVVEIVRLVAEM